jgi:hypothetical protein
MSQRAYVGVDLGGKFHQVQVTSADGSRLGKSFRIGRGRTALEGLRQGVRAAAAFHVRLRARGKHYKQASCALAAKILRRCWAVLREQRAYLVKHHTTLEQARQEGTTIRESVHEVAERLNDGGGVPSPVGEAKSSAASDQSKPNSPADPGAKRLRWKPAQPRTQTHATPETGLATAERSLS